MICLNHYDVVIFDCDGVIFDSNLLKVDAMKNALQGYSDVEIKRCVEYFSNNFGKSRYHHVEYFVKNIVSNAGMVKDYDLILTKYSKQCFDLYLSADFTEGVEELIMTPSCIKYVASGSDEKELNKVFESRGLTKYFAEVLGSPVAKQDNVKRIILLHPDKRILMIGDAKSDWQAAVNNEIDFLFVSEYTTVSDEVNGLLKASSDYCVSTLKEVSFK
jgi:phosphoglycolate phosphatase-like HAD superfamily hydrolase